MSPLSIVIALVGLSLYALFHRWYGGNGKPMSAAEASELLAALQARATNAHSKAALPDIEKLIASDDGKEFVMQNLVRYRARALYPPGLSFGDDPRAADRRYGRAIIGPLLRHASVVLFVAARTGAFMTPPGTPAWDYVAMVRYRSRRDFLRFALAVERDDIFVHKWAAIEETLVFPVRPLISLCLVRTSVAVLLAFGAAATAVLTH